MKNIIEPLTFQKISFSFLGDNRPDSLDSRRWKNPYIDKDNIKGKAVFRFYPFDKMGSLSQ